ncbi:SDR family NAD(P)-dependent oxidoreductase [Kineococcus sp. NBC_00420]|uniref:SDR family NAD(P)-dependent oxidoreductase n=1 Tax=Kineococcus sp. NBC_00420 TaxID=2903564 RepID=UPI002E20BB34
MPELITTRFDAASTAADVVEGVDLDGRRAIVTGASSGLGLETARALTAAGAEVTLAVRNVAAGSEVARRIASETGRRAPAVRAVDLADPASVAAFVDAWNSLLDVLVDNAGLVTSDLQRTGRGWELQFATNHLGHFALTTGLHRHLADAAAARGGSRVVVVSSTAHMRAPVDLADPHFEHGPYDPQIAYARSKSANSLFAVEATRRWRDDGVVANAVNPGGVATGLQRSFSPVQRASLAAAEAAGTFSWKTSAQGAATILVAAVSPEFAAVGGRYLDECREAHVVPDDATLAEHPHGVKRWAVDPDTARALWRLSTDLVS